MVAVERAATVTVSDDKIVTIRWSGLLNTDYGEPVRVARYPDKTVQVHGTFGTTAVVAMEGSNLDEPTTAVTDWGDCGDQVGAVLSIGELEPVVIAESPLWIRPIVSAGDGTTLLSVTIIAVAKGV